jgi:sulfatase maturation enzyme AslB (radical SAM superfamily)
MISQLAQFSVYNYLLTKPASLDMPLEDLRPDSYERDWHVARNPIKPLNHLDFLSHQEEIAAELNLHNILTPPLRFDGNYAILNEHQARKMSTQDVIEYLARQLYQEGRPLSADEITAKLREYARIRHMEFHPSDVCNLSCRDCTYAHDDPERKPPPINFPFAEIVKITQLKPRSMVIIGGGEPGLYKSGEHRFQEMVEQVQATNPDIHLALVTNGTYKPPGDWPDRFRWIRLSLDSAGPDTYLAFRGKPMFQRVIQNYLNYLDHETRYVGLSFLFGRANVHDYADVARFIFGLVRREKPQALPKVNIQYRPLRRDPSRHGRPFSQAVTAEQIRRVVTEIRELADSSPEMKAFLRNQTNILAILGGNTHPPHPFSRCYYSQTFRIVRASGDLRPCFVRVSEPDFSLGNIHTDSLETIALNSLYIGARRKPHCDAHGCRQCHVNYTFEQGLQGNLKPSDSAEVLADLMY